MLSLKDFFNLNLAIPLASLSCLALLLWALSKNNSYKKFSNFYRIFDFSFLPIPSFFKPLKTKFTRYFGCHLFLFFLTLTSCSKDEDYDKAKAVSLFKEVGVLSLDSSLKNTNITLPTQQNSESWPSKSCKNGNCSPVQNFKKSFNFREKGWFFKKIQEISLKKIASKTRFYLGDEQQNFIYHPVISENIAYFFDSNGVLQAISLQDFGKKWQKRIFLRSALKNYRIPKLSICNGKIFAIAGTNQIAAINQKNGEILWKKDLSALLISNPVCDEEAVFVLSDNNKIFSLNQENGELNWFSSGISRSTAIFGSASPVISGDKIIAAFSSGELMAINKKSGEVIWNQELAVNKATSSDYYLNDIDAIPVIIDDVVYAVGNGGLFKAINLKDGEVLWSQEISSVVDFSVAGDFIFLINNDNKLVAISRKSGGVKYIVELPAFAKENKPTSKYVYSSIIMAGDKLLISRLDGTLMIASPFNGAIEARTEIGRRIFSSPAIVNDKIYLLSIGDYTAEFSEWN